jgi:hypothetical protein
VVLGQLIVSAAVNDKIALYFIATPKNLVPGISLYSEVGKLAKNTSCPWMAMIAS